MSKLFKISAGIRLNILIIALLLLVHPYQASAHAYSASFTNIEFSDEKTLLTFSIDTLSLIELIEDLDKNQNGILEMTEVKKEEPHLLEFLEQSVPLDKNNEQQEAELKGMKIEKKEDREILTFKFEYPAFFPGDTITLMDGLYQNDSGTNYINLITASNRGEQSEAVLQGDNRTWTILLTEVQQEQGTEGVSGAGKDKPSVPQKEPVPQKTDSNSGWAAFFKLGTLHILTGYDHLLFLLALLLRKQTFKQYAAIITSFTIAHTITLSLAVTGVADLPSRFVEAAIAFSICYVATENLFRKEIRNRWVLTFGFGLIHGLGFANILQEMSLSRNHLAAALVSFNIGIEVVQLALVLLVLPLLSYIHRQANAGKLVKYVSWAIIGFGAFWLIERLFA